jgi:hypothetical protein
MKGQAGLGKAPALAMVRITVKKDELQLNIPDKIHVDIEMLIE